MNELKTKAIIVERKLFKTGFFHIFGGTVLNKIISFLSSLVLVRILSKQEYGVFTYAWNIYSIVILANGMGVATGILQLCSERSGDEIYGEKITNYGTRIGLIFDFFLMIVLLGIGFYAPLSISGASQLLLMISVLPFFQLMYELNSIYLRSQKRNQDYAKLMVFNTSILFLSSVIGSLLLDEKGMVLGYYIAYISSTVMSKAIFKIKLVSKAEKLTRAEKHSLNSISVVSMCNSGISQLLYLLDVFVLGIVVADETVLASYRVATIIPTALTFIPQSLITYIYPYFAEHRNDGKWCMKTYKKILFFLGMGNLCISLILFSFAPIFIEILFGKSYLDAVPVFRILSLNYCISGTFRIISGNLLVSQRKLKFNFLVAVISGLANLIGDFVLIKYMGSMGAALATVIVVIISSIMSTIYLIRTFIKTSTEKYS